ncbi:hypothetical protein [Pseudolactococcus insecticola]|uniref:Uncharacterized protein n=1 Tax=Pseudolactococcus insecticola TaxID=2709158 RepID=A0A6A0BA54_9LACT|nr:hypothetical protein [Lactococcus insecticola]GFH41244.1 hypothetical protein Hs20B_16420 [Lactococcus insecticola]
MADIDRTYSKFQEVREYHDRGMLKWQGFYLSEHTAAMEEDEKEKKLYPVLVIGSLI